MTLEHDEFWADFHRRRADRRARRAERWARRADRYADRGASYAQWAQESAYWTGWAQDMAHGVAAGVAQARARRSSGGALADLTQKVEEMSRMMKDLTLRVTALEKLAVDPDARLRAEIEKLRRNDHAPSAGD